MQAKEFLSRRQVAFEYVEIADLERPLETLRAITGGPVGTPIITIGDEFVVGFDPDWIDARLPPVD